MPFVPFGEKFPDIAERETRAVIVPNNNLVPSGKYGFEVLLKDKQYVERLKKHYQLLRKKIEEEPVEKTTRSIVASQKVGRNEPCPCDSGKKYKKCCYVVLH